MQAYELFIGLRYTRAKRETTSSLFLADLHAGGMGVLALIVVLSVMNGFQKEIRERMLGASPQLEIVQMVAD